MAHNLTELLDARGAKKEDQAAIAYAGSSLAYASP